MRLKKKTVSSQFQPVITSLIPGLPFELLENHEEAVEKNHNKEQFLGKHKTKTTERHTPDKHEF